MHTKQNAPFFQIFCTNTLLPHPHNSHSPHHHLWNYWGLLKPNFPSPPPPAPWVTSQKTKNTCLLKFNFRTTCLGYPGWFKWGFKKSIENRRFSMVTQVCWDSQTLAWRGPQGPPGQCSVHGHALLGGYLFGKEWARFAGSLHFVRMSKAISTNDSVSNRHLIFLNKAPAGRWTIDPSNWGFVL